MHRIEQLSTGRSVLGGTSLEGDAGHVHCLAQQSDIAHPPSQHDLAQHVSFKGEERRDLEGVIWKGQ